MASNAAFNRRSFVKGAAALAACAVAGTALSSTALAAKKSDDDATVVRLGVCGTVYEDVWAAAKEQLAQEGVDLQIVQFSDYVTPNNALANGEIDLNGFQHRIYLANEIEEYGYELSIVGNTFIVPLNLYSDKVQSLDELKDGDTIAIPNDPTNGGRALKVLEAAGLFTISEDADFNPTVDDIESYNVEVQIVELAANVIPSSLPDVTAGIVNGSYALDYGLKTEDALYQDTVLDIKDYWNLVAARTSDVEDPEKLALYQQVMAAFQTDATQQIFDDEFGGYFVAVGWGEDPLTEDDEDEDADEKDAEDEGAEEADEKKDEGKDAAKK
jgi:D-methionine transport system substrate-binding protein